LTGICKPVCYCDIDPAAQAVLKLHTRVTQRLPAVVVHTDVKIMPVPTADCVVAGFPCIGFSVVGKREGFEQPQSRLFYDMLKVIDASRASTVFLENVPGVLKDSREIVRELSVKRGFELRWCVLGACHAGAPHRRLRWFCLGLRSGSPLRHMTLQTRQGGYVPGQWTPKDAPPRTVTLQKTKEGKAVQRGTKTQAQTHPANMLPLPQGPHL